jgi:RNA polymerase sigma factor (sigma-70 family)
MTSDHNSVDDSPDWNHQDDTHLIESCLLGEPRAWEALLARYSRLIYAIPIHFGFPEPVVDEIFQETCVILIEKLHTLRDRARLNSWIMTITRRACLQFLRARGRGDSYGNLDANATDGTALDERLLRLERQAVVWRAIDNLDLRCQQLLKALFFTEPRQPYEVIAAAINISPGSVGPIRARCLEKVRQEIEKMDT